MLRQEGEVAWEEGETYREREVLREAGRWPKRLLRKEGGPRLHETNGRGRRRETGREESGHQDEAGRRGAGGEMVWKRKREEGDDEEEWMEGWEARVTGHARGR